MGVCKIEYKYLIAKSLLSICNPRKLVPHFLHSPLIFGPPRPTLVAMHAEIERTLVIGDMRFVETIERDARSAALHRTAHFHHHRTLVFANRTLMIRIRMR